MKAESNRGLGLGHWIQVLLLLSSDVIFLMLAFALGGGAIRLAPLAGAPHGLDEWLAHPIASHLILYIPASLVVIFQSWERGLYSRPYPFWDLLRQLFRSIFIAFVVELALLGYLSTGEIDKRAVIQTWLLAAIFVPLGRVLIKKILIGTGLGLQPILIVGSGVHAVAALRTIQHERFLGYRVIGIGVRWAQDMAQGEIKFEGSTFPIYLIGNAPAKKLEELGHPHVAAALESLVGEEGFFRELGQASRSLIVFPAIRGLPILGMEVSQFFSQDLLMLRLRNNLGRPGMRAIKRIFDLVASLVLLLGLSWFFLIVALLIKRSGRQVIYSQERVGLKGISFRCYKFCTMVPDAEKLLEQLLKTNSAAAAEWATDFKLKDDPRVTEIGKFLRRTSLDELPQLWNVLKGEMSLVGPRPIVREELARYGESVNYYLQIRPGITGVWQVSGRSDTTYEERVSMDAWYARNWSLWYDFVILVKTVHALHRRKGAY